MPPSTKTSIVRFVVPVLLTILLAFGMTKMPFRTTLRSLLPTKQRAMTGTSASSNASPINQLGLRIFAALRGENVLISPYSIAAALTLAAEGTEPGSVANEQFRALLPSPVSAIAPTDDAVTLETANAAWLGNVKEEYVQAVRKLDAEVRPLPQRVEEVNTWVSQATRGEIDKLLEELPTRLVALLVNAVFFKAPWTTKFDKDNTVPREFKGAGMVKMMFMRGESFRYKAVDSDVGRLQVVEIPYGNGEFGAVCVVPGDGVSIDDVVAKLQNGDEAWRMWTDGLVETKLDELAMPRFRIEYGAVSLKEALISMGLKAVWEADAKNPPFKRMTDDPSVFLSEVLHKTTVESTEEGTVASAATAVIMGRSARRPQPSVLMDRPFLFSIRRRGGELLFIGRVDKPVEP